ncbi:MAG: phage baseplate assembly protein V [Chitinophagaceae bacterium]
MGIEISKTQIAVDGKDIVFSNLSINQYLADVGSFSFIWRVKKDSQKDSYSEYVDFYNKNLSKSVVITIGTGDAADFTFKGFIHAISCSGREDTATEYSISGKGNIAKIDAVEECKSYYKKSLADIVVDALGNVEHVCSPQPSNGKELHYTVQYNQTKFDFVRMLAVRYGEWLFYDGHYLVFGSMFGDVVPVQIQKDIQDVNISAKIFKPSEKHSGFNTFTGKPVEKNGNDDPSVKNDIITAGADRGKDAFGSDQTLFTHSYAVMTEEPSFYHDIKYISNNQMESHYSNAMYLSARSGNSKLQLGGKLNVTDENGKAMGEYIIIQINHFSTAESQYQNSFVAIPSAVQKPPYTNPHAYPMCKAQPAIVKENEDDKGMGRIKVHFPWQPPNDTSPWLPVMVPHAGKDKGFHFLPEKEEQVMVDFIGNNAERPYIVGAFYAADNGHGNDHDGNNIKMIGTKTGRRLEIDDDKGTIKMQDYASTDNPYGNQVGLNKTNDFVGVVLNSATDKKNLSELVLNEKYGTLWAIFENGEQILKINMDASHKSISIHSKGSIKISADQQIDIKSGTINLNAGNINLNASGGESGGGKISIEGQEINAESKTTLDLKGLNTTLKGDTMVEVSGAMANLKGSGPTTIKGTPIAIN